MLVLLQKAWLHFMLIGVGLYALQQSLLPPVLPIVYLPTADKVAELRGQWLRTTGRPPSEQQIQLLIDNEVNQEILLQEAIRRGWHLSDSVVQQRLIRDMRFLDPDSQDSDERLINTAIEMELHENDLVTRRRLIQRMEMWAFASSREQLPDQAALQTLYKKQSETLQRPARVKFQHVFISSDKHADSQQQAQVVLQQLAERPTIEHARSLTEPFLHGLNFNLLSEKQVGRYFGEHFARDVIQLAANTPPQSQWLGPISSSYGEHLLLIERYEPAAPKSFQQVEKQLIAQWRRQQEQQALNALLGELRQRYRLQPDPEGVINAQ
jgi:hypothetical protein